MKWGRKNKSNEENKTKKTSNNSSSFSSSSHSFQLSHLFPFSWISRPKPEKQSKISPKQNPPISSDQFAAGEAPRRRSTGDEIRRRDTSDIARSARHYSLEHFELELRPISSRRNRDDHPPPPTPMKRAAEVRRRGQKIRPKVRAFSPKATGRGACEVKMRKRRNLESFAVAKSSRDPQKDFRESMVEMIRERRIRRPEEMERLLACYISLNLEENHEFIIKAFRQVLFDLGIGWFAGKCHCCRCCDCF